MSTVSYYLPEESQVDSGNFRTQPHDMAVITRPGPPLALRAPALRPPGRGEEGRSRDSASRRWTPTGRRRARRAGSPAGPSLAPPTEMRFCPLNRQELTLLAGTTGHATRDTPGRDPIADRHGSLPGGISAWQTPQRYGAGTAKSVTSATWTFVAPPGSAPRSRFSPLTQSSTVAVPGPIVSGTTQPVQFPPAGEVPST